MRIYLDNAATTKMSDTAIKAMIPYMNEIYGNPSSLHSVGQEANEALQNARERIARLLGCEPREITFKNTDALKFFCTGVISNLQMRLHLYHRYFLLSVRL